MESKISAPTRLEEILAEWDLDQGKDYEEAMDTITLSSTLNNVTISNPYTVTGAIGTNFPNTIYTTGTAGTSAPWATFNPNTASAKINLSGEDADIEVNGWSLVDAVKRIEERLDLFQLNPELEAEWADLKRLGDRYRKLEQRIKDKQATFDRLKAMPAPEVD
jgi:hypothetical protein